MKAQKPKDEALATLTKVYDTLTGDRPIDGLERTLLATTVKYAHEQVTQIEELKRSRKKDPV